MPSSLAKAFAFKAICLPLPILFMAFPTKPHELNFMIGFECLPTCLTFLIELLGEYLAVTLIFTEDLGVLFLIIGWTEFEEIPPVCFVMVVYALVFPPIELKEMEFVRPNLV